MREESEAQQSPEMYYYFIERVGAAGNYQWLMFFMSILSFLLVGLMTLSTAYVFMNKTYDCTSFSQHTLSEQECEHYICENLSA